MQNPNFPFDPSMNPLLGAFQNLNLQSNINNNNGNVNEGNDDRAMRNLASLSVNPNPVFAAPIGPLQRTLLAPLRPPPGFERSLPITVAGEFSGNINNVHNDRVFRGNPNLDLDTTLSMLRSLGLFGMMTCEAGLAEFQKLLNICSKNILRLIGARVTRDRKTFLCLATHQSGSGAVRTLLRRSDHLAGIIFCAVCENFFELMTSKYGQYVVAPTLRAVEKDKKNALYRLAEVHALRLACNEVGCASLNELLEDVRGQHRDRILNLIASNALWLAQDPYGNFVVQHVLTLQNPFITDRIGRLLYGHCVQLSFQRLGSYVVEKCLKSSWAMVYVLEELIKSEELVRLAKNEFGNYVVQCALRAARGPRPGQYEELVQKLRPHFAELQRGYGRSTLKLIETLEQEKDHL